ncbi:hypothetical protein HOD29_04280 [archaeon]|nr:hypothetical protein [archaeon]
MRKKIILWIIIILAILLIAANVIIFSTGILKTDSQDSTNKELFNKQKIERNGYKIMTHTTTIEGIIPTG